MIFPNLQLEDVVQANDKTRLDATKSFISKDEAAITLVEVEAETGSGFIEVGAPGVAKDWYLDWEYATTGSKTVSCRITTDGAPTTKSFTLEVLSSVEDNLFSYDSDLTALEADVLRWVPAGRNSFKNYHRKAQRLIVAWLNENGHTDSAGLALTKDAIVDIEEVRSWSAALTMQLIFRSISNDPLDTFSEKSKQYESMALTHRNRAVLRLDTDGDGEVSLGEGVRVNSLSMVRR
jgi:hypothetical protein